MKINRLQSLAAHLSLWIVSLGTLIFIAVLGFNYYLSLQLLKDDIDEITNEKALSTVREIETVFSSAAISANSLASIISTSGNTDKKIHQSIKAILNANTSIYGMTVALEPYTPINPFGDYSPYYFGDNNKPDFSDLADNNYDYQSKLWYSEAKQKNKPIWSEPYFDEGGGNVRMITYSTPIYLPDSKIFAGVATADIKLKFLDKIINNAKTGTHGYGVIVSDDDAIIAQSEGRKKLTKVTKSKIGEEKWQHYQESKKSPSPLPFESSCPTKENGETDAQRCRFTIKTLSNNNWKVIIVFPVKELTAKIDSLTINIAIIAALGLITLFLAVIYITRYLTKPLAQLAGATKDIGAGHLDTKIPDPIREDEIGALTDDFNSMRNALKIYIDEVQEATAKQQKMESEIQIAKDIQMSMVPGSGNAFIEVGNYELFATLKPARSVGGDLYYFQQSGDNLHFIVGDVSDKGVPAALFMAKTITLYTRALRDKLKPGKTFTMMNDILAQNNDACMFVTALCGTLNLTNGSIQIANAGHMNPILKNADGTMEHEVDGGTALGLMEGTDYTDVDFKLPNDTSLIMYTDGISEAHDTNNNQYTDEKLIKLISGTEPTNSKQLGDKIICNVEDFAAGTEQFDDITLMIIHYA